MAENNFIFVEVFNLEKMLFQGKASSLSSYNLKGNFDILPLHSNFISLVSKYLIINLPTGEKKEFSFQEGILQVHKDKVKVLIT